MKLQNYNFILYHILGKTNTKADVLSRKDQVDTKEDNKDVSMLKDKIWTRQQIMAEVVLIWKNQAVEKTILLEEIQRNNTKEQEIIKELEKNNGQVWEEDGIVDVKRRIYISNNRKSWLYRYRTSRTITNVWVDQKKLLVAKNQRGYQKICSRIYKIPAKQSAVHKKSGELYPLEMPKEL